MDHQVKFKATDFIESKNKHIKNVAKNLSLVMSQSSSY